MERTMSGLPGLIADAREAPIAPSAEDPEPRLSRPGITVRHHTHHQVLDAVPIEVTDDSRVRKGPRPQVVGWSGETTAGASLEDADSVAETPLRVVPTHIGGDDVVEAVASDVRQRHRTFCGGSLRQVIGRAPVEGPVSPVSCHDDVAVIVQDENVRIAVSIVVGDLDIERSWFLEHGLQRPKAAVAGADQHPGVGAGCREVGQSVAIQIGSGKAGDRRRENPRPECERAIVLPQEDDDRVLL